MPFWPQDATTVNDLSIYIYLCTHVHTYVYICIFTQEGFLATTLLSRRHYCSVCRNCVGVVGTTVETVVETAVFL